MIGLSLSGCVRQIADGKVKIDDVEKVISGCLVRTMDDFINVIGEYMHIAWNYNPECEGIAFALYEQGKIEFPRAEYLDAPLVAGGIWCSEAEFDPVLGDWLYTDLTFFPEELF